jgi:hypothetical protein
MVLNLPKEGISRPVGFSKSNITLPMGKYGDLEELEKHLKNNPNIRFVKFNE